MTQNALNRSGLPNKAEILAFVKASGEVNRHKIARSFNVKKSNRAALRAMIKELRREGIFDFLAPERVGNDHSRELPKVAVARLLRNDKGRWQAKLVDKQFEELVVIPLAPDLQRQNLAKLFQGELILCRLTKNERAGPQIQQIIRFLSGEKGKANRKVSRQGDLGPDFAIIHKKKHGLFAELIDRRRNETIEIRDTAFGVGQLDQDDIVQLDPVKPGLVLRKLTRLNATDAPTQMSITRHQLPDQFSSQAQLEAKQLQIFGETEVATGKKRQDWTHLPFVTIDPADAKDHDDAVYAQPLPEKKGWRIYVAIADVAYYVEQGGKIDQEAYQRGVSVYFPDRVLPMLPTRLSNDLCSLRRNELRPVLGVIVDIDQEGQKLSHQFCRAKIISQASLSYRQAQDLFEQKPAQITDEVQKTLTHLLGAYSALAKAKSKRTPLKIELPERKLIFDSKGEVKNVAIKERFDAHMMIEEMMILANCCAAQSLDREKKAQLYRIHEPPSQAKIEALSLFLRSIGLKWDRGQAPTPQRFNHLLSRSRGEETEEAVHEMVLRNQSQAQYSPGNLGHFGLNLPQYSHFTSPIRRYADLVIHRQLISALGLDDEITEANDLEAAAIHISRRERLAMTAEREATDAYLAKFLRDGVGGVFEARISGVIRAGLFLRLSETGADGFIPKRFLGHGHFIFDEEKAMLRAANGRKSYRLGQKLTVKLLEVRALAGALLFAPAR